MNRITNYRLIQIADLNRQRTVGARHRTEVADMAVAANPDRWSLWQRPLVIPTAAEPDSPAIPNFRRL